MDITRLFLFVTEGTFQRRRYTLDVSHDYIIGRAEECDIRLDPGQGAGEVSREHCVVEVNLADVAVRDLGSLTGTFINGESLGRGSVHKLEAGDLLRVGHAVIRTVICFAERSAEEFNYSPCVLWL